MSLVELAKKPVEGLLGRLLLGAATTLIAGGVGYIVHTSIDHTSMLAVVVNSQASLSNSIADLKHTFEKRNDEFAGEIGKLTADETALAIAKVQAESRLAALEAEHERVARVAEREPSEVYHEPPNIFDALQHALGPQRRARRR